MEKIKAILDREKMSTEQIEAKQDFDKVLKLYNKSTTTFYKSPWFYGPVGLATIGTVVALTTMGNNNADQNEMLSKKKFDQILDKNPIIRSHSISIAKIPDSDIVETTKYKAVEKNLKPLTKMVSSSSELKMETVKMPEDVKSKPVSLNEVKKVSTTKRNSMPSIGGVYTGKIKIDALFDENGIVYNEDIIVKSYTIRFHDGKDERSVLVNGKTIPFEIKKSISEYNINSMIFITDIRAIHNVTGKEYLLSSMNFIPINN